MRQNSLVKVPDESNKITRRTIKDATYIYYEVGRTYSAERQYTTVTRKTIGKAFPEDNRLMYPNQNYFTLFPNESTQETPTEFDRSSCMKVGANLIIDKILNDSRLTEILSECFSCDDLGLLLDLVSYTLIAENNAGQYYPEYAFNHSLHSKKMHIYSDSKVSSFLHSITDNQRIKFLELWNKYRDHQNSIYISYDSTNKSCQAGDIEIVEFGKPKVDEGHPIFNYAIAYDTYNREPLFYEEYPGSINDISQFQFTLEKVKAYGYSGIGFILDRGYFSKANIEAMDRGNYEFVIMLKGMAALVKNLVQTAMGTFENNRECYVPHYKIYGTTVKGKLFENDTKLRYFHIFYRESAGAKARENIDDTIEKLSAYLKKQEFAANEPFSYPFTHYFNLYYDENDGSFLGFTEKADVIEEERKFCGYFVLVTSRKMTAQQAISIYKNRDSSEKLFSGDKSYLGNKSVRNYTNESVSAKIFVEFIALIVRSKIYTSLKDEMLRNHDKANYMTVPAAIKELEKIEMIKMPDQVYRLDHAVTATQKAILSAFGLDDKYIKKKAPIVNERLLGVDFYTKGNMQNGKDKKV